jgi:hypothetical protein
MHRLSCSSYHVFDDALKSHFADSLSFCLHASLQGFFFTMAQQPPGGPMPPHYGGFTITFRHTALVRTPLDEWLVHRKELYLTTHNTYNGHPCPRWDSNPQSQHSTREQPQTYALDRAAVEIGTSRKLVFRIRAAPITWSKFWLTATSYNTIRGENSRIHRGVQAQNLPKYL